MGYTVGDGTTPSQPTEKQLELRAERAKPSSNIKQ
jgi:hypothetical protein